MLQSLSLLNLLLLLPRQPTIGLNIAWALTQNIFLYFQFRDLVRKFAADNHPVAQEKGLEAVLAFAESCDVDGPTARDVVVGVIGFCLASPKGKIREAAHKVCSFFIVVHSSSQQGQVAKLHWFL